MDTADGFEQHRAWERTLYDGGWAAVSWPVEYGGRGVDLIRWLIFEEEYWRAGAPGRVNQNGMFLLGPTIMEFGTDEQKARFLPRMASGDGHLVPGLVGAERGQRPGRHPQPGRARGRRMGAHRPEDLVLARRFCGLDVRDLPYRGRRRAPPRPDVHPRATRHRRRHRTPHRATRRRDGIRRDLLRSRTRARDEHPRGGGQGLGGRDGRGRLRARSQPPQSRPLRGHRAAAHRAVPHASPSPHEREAVVRAWMDAEAYSLHTYWTVSRLLGGGAIGAEASLNKVFWSEMDLRMHETALASARAATPTTSAVARRVPVLAVGPDLRRHQRDPAQRDRRASPRAAAELTRCASSSRRTSSCSATRCASCSTRSARPRTCAPCGPPRPAARPSSGRSSSRWAWSASRCPRSTAGSASTRSTSC